MVPQTDRSLSRLFHKGPRQVLASRSQELCNSPGAGVLLSWARAKNANFPRYLFQVRGSGKENMTIENAEAYVAGIWDWGILRGCFGDTKIEPTDIDGFVERKGQFLLIEAKDKNAALKTGQRITFEALHKTGFFTVLIAWGETNKPERIELWHNGKRKVYDPANLEKLRVIVSWWFKWADRKG